MPKCKLAARSSTTSAKVPKKKSLNNNNQQEYNEEWVASPWVAASYRDLTPDAVQPSQALVTLNGFVTLVTLGGAVPFHPEMMHYLWRDRGRGSGGRQQRDEEERR